MPLFELLQIELRSSALDCALTVMGSNLAEIKHVTRQVNRSLLLSDGSAIRALPCTHC